MNDTDRRLAKEVKEALEHITSEARCYCPQEQPEYLEIKKIFEEKIHVLKEQGNACYYKIDKITSYKLIKSFLTKCI